jgi:hypothetical protein
MNIVGNMWFSVFRCVEVFAFIGCPGSEGECNSKWFLRLSRKTLSV